MQNYFGIALGSNVGNLAAMKSVRMASLYHIWGYQDNCPKCEHTWCQFQKDKQDNTNYYKSRVHLPVDVGKSILPIYQSLCNSEMSEKCLHGKTQNANESFNRMIWNRVPKATHVRLDALFVSVYHAIAHINNGEKAALDIMELLKNDPRYYMTKSCRSINMRHKGSSIYMTLEPQKKCWKVLRHSKKRNKT